MAHSLARVVAAGELATADALARECADVLDTVGAVDALFRAAHTLSSRLAAVTNLRKLHLTR